MFKLANGRVTEAHYANLKCAMAIKWARTLTCKQASLELAMQAFLLTKCLDLHRCFKGCRMIAQRLCDQQLCSSVYAHTPSQEFVGDRASMQRISTANTPMLNAWHITDQSVMPHNFTQLWFTFDAHPWPFTQGSHNRTKAVSKCMRMQKSQPLTQFVTSSVDAFHALNVVLMHDKF